MKKLLLLFVNLLFIIAMFSQSRAVITAFRDGDWSAVDTWVGNIVPVAGDNVIIPDGITVTIQSATYAAATDVDVQTGGQLINLGSLVLVALGADEVYNPITGDTWMDRNLGASQIATASDDAAAYGDLYQWGRSAEGHESRTSLPYAGPVANPNTGNDWDGNFITVDVLPWDWLTPQDNNLWQGANGTNNPCPSGFRLPTQAEWDAERLSWATNNAAGAFDSPLKLVVGGLRNRTDGSLTGVGSLVYYWSSSFSGEGTRVLYIYSTGASMLTNARAFGNAVRCIKD